MRFEPLLALSLLIGGCAATPPPEAPLASADFSTLRPARVRNLVAVVHADLPEGRAVDYAAFARRAAAAVPGGAAVVLLRPGYADAAGATSPGARDRGVGDGYSPETVRLLGRSVRALRARYRQARLILVGDGGGAVLAANLAATQPGVVDSLMLVDCPCALPEWRRHMARGNRAFAASVDSLDPLQTIGGLPAATRVAIVSGGKSALVPDRITRLYAEALALRGIGVEYRRLEGSGATLLDDPEITRLLARLADSAARNDSRT